MQVTPRASDARFVFYITPPAKKREVLMMRIICYCERRVRIDRESAFTIDLIGDAVSFETLFQKELFEVAL